MVCENCGTKMPDNAKFCDNCGVQLKEEQENMQAERLKNYDANVDKTMSDSIWITVGMAVFSLFFIVFVGFEKGEPMVITLTAIAFSIFICSLKWFFEIKNQRKWKKETEEKEKGSD